MGGRGTGGGLSSKKVDVGFGVSVKQSTLDLRRKVNEAIGAGTDDDLIAYSVRRDIASGKTEKQLVQEDNERLKRAEERKKAREEGRQQPQRTFVNGFGEATTRDITSQTYDRQQRRQQRDILRNMGYDSKGNRR